MRVIRDRKKRTITFFYDQYIEKIAKRFKLNDFFYIPAIFFLMGELYKFIGQAIKADIKAF